MNTAHVMHNMNFLPKAFAELPQTVKETMPKVQRTSTKEEAKFWRYTDDLFMIQPTGGLKLDKDGKQDRTSKPLNFNLLYVSLQSNGRSLAGINASPEKLFELMKADRIRGLQEALTAWGKRVDELAIQVKMGK